MGEPRALRMQDLGVIPFEEGLARMRALAEQRAREEGEDTLLFMRHPEVLSVGRRRGARDNILDFEIPVVEVDRGGDVTWHGPGQLVGYPVVRLRDGERDVVRVLRQLEDGLIEVLGELGLDGAKNPPHTGVWVRDGESGGGLVKVCSMGLGFRSWVAMHGFALNVDNDLKRFRTIRPCGLDSAVMGSLESLGVPRERRVGIEERVYRAVARALGRECG